jgi:hypothetical protein
MQTQTQEQSQFITSLAIDVVDAYTFAHVVINEFSAIFEALEKLSDAGTCTGNITHKLSSVGFRHAVDRLKFIDRRIIETEKTLTELREEQRLCNAA